MKNKNKPSRRNLDSADYILDRGKYNVFNFILIVSNKNFISNKNRLLIRNEENVRCRTNCRKKSITIYIKSRSLTAHLAFTAVVCLRDLFVLQEEHTCYYFISKMKQPYLALNYQNIKLSR